MAVSEVEKKLRDSRLECGNALGMQEKLDCSLVAGFGSRNGRRAGGWLLCGGRVCWLDCC